MFIFNRSVFSVLAPLALLIAVVLFSNLSMEPVPLAADAPQAAPAKGPTTVARIEPPRRRDGG